MYNLIEYSDNYLKTRGSLGQYYRDEPFLDANGAIADFSADNNRALFKFETNIVRRIKNDGTKNVKIMRLLKYLGNLWRTLEIPFINLKLILY